MAVTDSADGAPYQSWREYLAASRGGAARAIGRDALLNIELWDPATLSFSVAGTLSGLRSGHTTTALPDGRAVIVGGAPGEVGNAPLSEPVQCQGLSVDHRMAPDQRVRD